MNAFDVFNPFRLDARTRSYKGAAQLLSDPTDLLHIWSCRDVSRNSGLLGATLRRTADGVEADFGFTSKGYLDRAAVLAWAGASAVTVVRLWGLRAITDTAARALTNYQTHGCLYNWAGALAAAPPGWKVPSDSDLHALETYYTTSGDCLITRETSGCSGAATALVSGGASGFGWTYSGVAAPAAGATFQTLNTHGFLWSASESSAGNAIRRYTQSGLATVFRNSAIAKSYAHSVRLIRDTSVAISGWSPGDNFTDARDGTVYGTIALPNGQVWMRKNLAYFGVGVPLCGVTDGSLTRPKAYIYGLDLVQVPAIQTTVLNQPPLDLTSNPLRIGAAAGTSLVATMPAITGAKILTADQNGVALATANISAGSYTVQSNSAFRERVILKGDTPEADIEAVKRNMMRAWKLGAAA